MDDYLINKHASQESLTMAVEDVSPWCWHGMQVDFHRQRVYYYLVFLNLTLTLHVEEFAKAPSPDPEPPVEKSQQHGGGGTIQSELLALCWVTGQRGASGLEFEAELRTHLLLLLSPRGKKRKQPVKRNWWKGKKTLNVLRKSCLCRNAHMKKVIPSFEFSKEIANPICPIRTENSSNNYMELNVVIKRDGASEHFQSKHRHTRGRAETLL